MLPPVVAASSKVLLALNPGAMQPPEGRAGFRLCPGYYGDLTSPDFSLLTNLSDFKTAKNFSEVLRSTMMLMST